MLQSARWTKPALGVTALAMAAGMVLGAAGCASPGPPRPPSLRLPRIVRDLQAQREGDDVMLRWTAPQDTTDSQPLWHKHAPEPMTAVLCRVQQSRCVDVVKLPVAMGEVCQATDHLPAPLTQGAPRTLAYRIRVLNGAGRDAGSSRDALALAGSAPPAMTGLAATTTAAGVQLTWQAAPSTDAIRVVAEPLEARNGKQQPTRLFQVSREAAANTLAAGDAGGAVDSAAATGVRTRYRVYRLRTLLVNGTTLTLQGNAAEITAMRSPDVFPPSAPTGLLAESFGLEGTPTSVSLSWEANGEPDVAGYYVYRSPASGSFVRITPKPVRGVSWNDTPATGLVAGQHYRYVVTAVDGTGNESARSAPVDVESH